VGVVALLLLGGAAAAFVVLGKKPPTPTVATTASASAAPAESAAPSASASAAPAADSAAPAADSATPAADSATPAASGTPDAKPESMLSCDPSDCDEIKVDDKPIDVGKPVVLTAGKHTVIASKAGYQTAKETIVVKEGEKFEKTFKLKEKAAPPTNPQPSPNPQQTAKPCGKFLKRCK
jgi:hypothetical protein